MLSQQQILTSSFNDIVFQDRNKGYGAYLLRKEYNLHMKVAMGSMLGLCLASFVFYFSGTLPGDINPGPAFEPGPVTLIDPPPPPHIPVPPVPPAHPAVQQAIRTEVFAPPVIVKDAVATEDLPPEQDALVNAQIGLVKTDGIETGNVVAPPVEPKGLGAVVALKVEEDPNTKIWTKVENPAEFPGGQGEWIRYLQKNLRYPEPAFDKGTQGVVRVQFIVDREGNISEVQALNDPGDGLAEEAVRIIKKGPKWKPAEQNGRKVIYRPIQAIVFRID